LGNLAYLFFSTPQKDAKLPYQSQRRGIFYTTCRVVVEEEKGWAYGDIISLLSIRHVHIYANTKDRAAQL